MICEYVDCPNTATMLARSVQEVMSEDGPLWVTDEERVYCAAHFTPGAATHLDSSVTQHAAMSAEDA